MAKLFLLTLRKKATRAESRLRKIETKKSKFRRIFVEFFEIQFERDFNLSISFFLANAIFSELAYNVLILSKLSLNLSSLTLTGEEGAKNVYKHVITKTYHIFNRVFAKKPSYTTYF